MAIPRPRLLAALLLALLAILAGCPASPSQQTTPAPATASAVAANLPAPTVTPIATSTAAPSPTATATVAPTPTSTATSVPAATIAPAAGSPVATPPPASVDLGEASFDQVVTPPSSAPQRNRGFVKHGKMRMDVNVGGQKMAWLVDTAKDVAYIWTVDQNVALKMTVAQFLQQSGGYLDPLSIVQSAHAGRKVGNETLDGKQADIFEYTSLAGPTRAWIWGERNFPLRTETTTPLGAIVAEFRNIAFGNVTDSVFVLPSRVEVTDLSTLPVIPTPAR